MPGKSLEPVKPQPGRPLYAVVKDAVLTAIERGTFAEGEQMPSTQQLSKQLEVSLVTAHRALQELVSSGVLQRSQGRGTFVDVKYKERYRAANIGRIGLVFHGDSSLADHYHSQILEGVRQAGQAMNIDLTLLRFGDDFRNDCRGFLFINPFREELGDFIGGPVRRNAALVVGAKSDVPGVMSLDVDNIDLAVQATRHLLSLGHKKLAYVGDERASNSRDRWTGFSQTLPTGVEPQVLKTEGWRLSDGERKTLVAMLKSPKRPTAIFAAGYYFALDIYAVAQEMGVKIPEEISIIAVDDPVSAGFLSPPLTTMRQPLVELGYASIGALVDRMQDETLPPASRTLYGELVIRKSTAAPKGDR